MEADQEEEENDEDDDDEEADEDDEEEEEQPAKGADKEAAASSNNKNPSAVQAATDPTDLSVWGMVRTLWGWLRSDLSESLFGDDDNDDGKPASGNSAVGEFPSLINKHENKQNLNIRQKVNQKQGQPRAKSRRCC